MRSLQELKRARYICTVQSAIIQSLNFRPFLEYTFRLFFGQTTRPTNPEVLTMPLCQVRLTPTRKRRE